MKSIAIIGNAGTNARPWTDAFLAAGWQVRKLVRTVESTSSSANLTAVGFDFDDPASHVPALAGTDVLALITPALPRQVEWETALIEAARRAGVAAIIKLSVIGADVMTKCSQLARHITGRHAGLDTDQAPRHIREPGPNPAATELLTQYNRPFVIQANLLTQRRHTNGRIDV